MYWANTIFSAGVAPRFSASRTFKSLTAATFLRYLVFCLPFAISASKPSGAVKSLPVTFTAGRSLVPPLLAAVSMQSHNYEGPRTGGYGMGRLPCSHFTSRDEP